MASTKAKKKTEASEVVKKVVEKLVEEPVSQILIAPEIEPEAPKDKILHLAQLRAIEVSERDVHNARLTMAVEEQSLQNLILQSKYLGLAIEKQKALVDAKSQAYELEKKRYELIASDILTLHGIEGVDRFAYDPNTGKIIL